MGVPSFFRWLLEKYPRVVKYVKEEFIEYDDEGERILPDSSGKNPNGTEYDNLYLDMNGIIHPCCHPEGGPQPKNENEMIQNVFKYIEHIFSMVRPRKLLYLAIDGVAPRAKMNQQRARRFRAAQEREELLSTRRKLESYYHGQGWNVPDAPPQSWDHNVITPGTPFMDKLAQALRYWVSYKLHNDAGWKGIKVVLSDANIPGEGEHKIAQFIRRCRGLSGYDPNTRHVLYGLDADLFMLGLATHEVRFTILREEVLFGKNRPCDKCGLVGHFTDKCRNPPKEIDKDAKKTLKPFIFADLCILREYLEYELFVDLDWWNLERVIDDFVFLCFFVGNDFLPHLPSLEIREGAIDNLIKNYKEYLPTFGGYLTEHGGKVNLDRAQILLRLMGQVEDQVFKNRTHSDAQHKKRKQNKHDQKRRERIYKQRQKNKENKQEANPAENATNANPVGNYYDTTNSNAPRDKWAEMRDIKLEECTVEDEYDESQKEFLQFFEEYDLEVDDHFMEKDFEHQLKAIHRVTQDVSKCKKKQPEEDMLFGTKGFKQRYYFKKMHINYDEKPAMLKRLIYEYVRGLCWVYKYYYQGCASWSWYYPFHYAPFASDLADIADLGAITFELSKPFSPFGQLMGVLPASSGKVALPQTFSRLMYEKTSPIVDFYPTDFKLDLNGKMYSWQAVILLPFVDADRLCKAIAPLEKELNDDLKRMNGTGDTLLFMNKSHPLCRSVVPLYNMEDSEEKATIAIDPQISQGINGTISPNVKSQGILYGKPLVPPTKVQCLDTIEDGVDVVNCVFDLVDDFEHKSVLLDGAKVPDVVLDQTDLEHMEKAHRFGKPRHFKRRDTHYNYNRGWDANIGYAGGRYKAKHNKNARFELDYQPTRREYEEHRNAEARRYDEERSKRYKEGPKWVTDMAQRWVPKGNNSFKQIEEDERHLESNSNELHDHIQRAEEDDKSYKKQRYQNNNYNNKRYQNNSRSYQSQRRNNNNGAPYRQQQNYPQYNQYYNNNQYNQPPTHQQWYPQQGYYNNYAPPPPPQQNAYYNNNNNYYQQAPYYQPQQQQQQNYSQRNYQRRQPPKESNQQQSRKWG